MSISKPDIKKLYGLSAGRCNICGFQLIEKDLQVGEMAHITAKKSGGPRGEVNLENDNSYENLILLCPTHHTMIDKDPNKYTSSKLRQIKKDFEDSIRESIENKEENLNDVLALNYLFEYIPITDFSSLASHLPSRVSIDFEIEDVFERFCIANPHLYPFQDEELNVKWNKFISNFKELEHWITGSISGLKLITIDDMRNSQLAVSGYNIYVNNDNGSMVLNNAWISSEQRRHVREQVETIKQKFMKSHFELVKYIGSRFKGIKWK